MNLSSKAVAWHLGSVAAGAWGMAVFAQSDSVDLYKLIAQLKQTWGDLVILSSMLAPILAAGAAAYRTYSMKQVPQTSVAVHPETIDPGPSAQTAIVTGKIVGALLLGVVMIGGLADCASAQQTVSPLVPASGLRAVLIADLAAARDDAKANDDPAEACWALLLDHANAMPPKIMGLAHGAQRLRDVRRGLPKVMETCAVVKDGARAAIIQIFAVGASGASALAFFGL